MAPPFQAVSRVRAATLEFLYTLPLISREYCVGRVYFQPDGKLECDLMLRTDPMAVLLHTVLALQHSTTLSDESLWQFGAFISMAGCLNGCASLWLKDPNLAYADGRPVPLDERRIICPRTLITADNHPDENLISVEHMIAFFLGVPDIKLEPGPWTSIQAVIVSEEAMYNMYKNNDEGNEK